MSLSLTDAQKVGHLLRRFGFGASLEDRKIFEPLGPKKAMETMLRFEDSKDVLDPMRFVFMKDEEAQPGAYRFRAHWITQMVVSQRPLREKLALFWHDHFACSEENVAHGLAMMDYMAKLRHEPAGKFRDILERMTKSTAVMRELNVEMVTKAQPNENFARELLELYTLGEGHYTEKDIKEVSRAITGWSFLDVYWRLGEKNDERLKEMRRWDTPAIFNFYAPDAHIAGPKKVLGQTVDTFDDVLDMLAKHPQTARYICTKLWEWFAYQAPEEAVVERLAKKFLATDGLISAVLVEMTEMPEFWGEKCYRNQIKNPWDYVIGICRAQNVQSRVAEYVSEEKDFTEPVDEHFFGQMGHLNYICQLCGMDLFYPPSVAGWDWGSSWITTNTMLRRKSFRGIFAYYPVEKDNGEKEWLPDMPTRYVYEQVKSRNPQNSEEMATAYLKVYDAVLSPKQLEVLTKKLDQHGGVKLLENEKACMWVLHVMIETLGMSPEFQLC